MPSPLSFQIRRAGRRSSRPPRWEGEAARIGVLNFSPSDRWRSAKRSPGPLASAALQRSAPGSIAILASSASSAAIVPGPMPRPSRHRACPCRGSRWPQRSARRSPPRETSLGRGGPFGAGGRETIWLHLSANLFVGRSAHVDIGDNTVTIEMANQALADPAPPAERRPPRQPPDGGGEPAPSHEIPPGRQIGPNSLSLGPAFGDGPIGDISGPCPIDGWEARRQSGEFAQALADVA